MSDPKVFNSPRANPRSWLYVSNLLKVAHKLNSHPDILRVVVAGCVGVERATAFFSFLKGGVRPLTALEVLYSYRSNRKALLAWVEQGRLDLVETAIFKVEIQLQSHTAFQAVHNNPEHWKNLGCFLSDLPGDLQTKFEEFFEEHDYPLPPKERRKT